MQIYRKSTFERHVILSPSLNENATQYSSWSDMQIKLLVQPEINTAYIKEMEWHLTLLYAL